jgi:predicted Rossmann-fold nucleotide-binding protein
MRIDQELPMVAVFGSNHPNPGELPAARLLGAAVNLSDAVLLTGGDLIERETVKDAAIWAAQGSGTPASPARWVGVGNRSRAQPAQKKGPRSLVVTPGWSDRRNFVEACLCDAAIAIGGSSEGTASEALFCLYLGRPVVMVGDLPDAQASPAALRQLAVNRVKPEQPGLAVDAGIAGAYAWADNADATAEIRSLPRDPESAATLVVDLMARITQPSPRPDFESLVNERDWDAYVRTALVDAGRWGDPH